jgi:signal transduction histidine kinase/CheY-like chemotaxis protein
MREIDSLRLLRALDEAVVGKSGATFFRELARAVGTALNAHYAFAAEIDLEAYKIHEIAAWLNGEFIPTETLELKGSPCERVLNGQIAAIPGNLPNLFPAERDAIASVSGESFLAIPLLDDSGCVRGHFGAIDKRPRDWGETDFDILRIFALRAGAELARLQAERKLAATNAALADANSALRAEIVRRTEVERQLQNAKLAADAANQAKSAFLANMSHELRTPLNGILGYAQLLKRRMAPASEEHSHIEIVERSGEHLLNLINDVLDLAKIEAGRIDIRPAPFDVGQLLRDVASLIGVRAEQAGLRFKLEFDESLPLVASGDERALRQILLNVLSNAVKFTPQGEVSFRARASPPDAGRCTLNFEIRDTGIGIAPADMEQLFQPFQRGSTGGRRFEGTGLGLALSRRLAESMGGRLTVESRLGAGTRVLIEIPLALVAAEVQVGPSAKRVTGYDGARRTIVIADDDEASRELIVSLLHGLDFRVHALADGVEVLDRARQVSADLIVTDLSMPGLNGLEVARQVRSDATLAALPVIAVSASTSRFSRGEALGAGCSSFVEKPVHFDELLAEIGRLLKLSWRDAPAAVPAGRSAGEGRGAGQASPAIVAELLDCARRGDVTQLLARVREAEGSDPAGAGVYGEVRRLAAAFDMKGIRRILEDRSAAAAGTPVSGDDSRGTLEA